VDIGYTCDITKTDVYNNHPTCDRRRRKRRHLKTNVRLLGKDSLTIGGGGKNDSRNDEQGENDCDEQDGGGKNNSTSRLVPSSCLSSVAMVGPLLLNMGRRCSKRQCGHDGEYDRREKVYFFGDKYIDVTVCEGNEIFSVDVKNDTACLQSSCFYCGGEPSLVNEIEEDEYIKVAVRYVQLEQWDSWERARPKQSLFEFKKGNCRRGLLLHCIVYFYFMLF
jgi:hypothetical protein